MIDPSRFAFQMGIAGLAQIALELGSIFAEIMPETGQIAPGLCAEGFGKRARQGGYLAKMILQKLP